MGKQPKKPVVQTINRSNQTTESRSAPGFFVLDPNVYATVKNDNRVEFFYTGEDYFSRLADAIDTAKTSIYIAGWQINYDVLLKSPPAPVSTERSRWEEKERALQAAGVEDLLNDTYELALTKGYDGTNKFINDLATNTATNGLKSSLTTAAKTLQQKSLAAIPYLPTFEELKEFSTKILDAVDIKGEFTRIVENANKGLENSLWQHLRKAVKRGVNVYVLPWSCPPIGPVNTGDLDTMLAVFQLNAGLQDEAGNPVKRAHFMFSTTRCDFPGLASLFFSHHQKTVIIDNQIGFVGGIDIAYGRRDNKQYSLDVSNRFGNDRYNPNIPHVNTALRSTHVSRSALFISTLFNISAEAQVANQLLTFADAASTLKNWLNTPLSWDVAYDIRLLFQLGNIVLEAYKDSYKELLEYGIAIFGAFFGEYQVKVLDQLFLLYDNTRQHFYDWQNATRVTFEEQQPIINQIVQNIDTIKYLAGVEGIPGYPYTETIIALHKMDKPVPRELYILAIPEVRQWLVNTQPGQFAAAIMDITPTDDATVQEATAFAQAKDLALSTIWHVFTLLQNRGLTKESPYYYLEEKFQALGPTGGVTLNGASQPRMPWHDMQVELEGPAVYDLARNFIDRWNCDQVMIQENSQPLMDNDLFVAILDWADRIVKGFDVSQWFIDSPDIKKALTDLGDELLASTPTPDWIKTSELLPPAKPEEIKAANLTADNKALVQIIRSAAKQYQKAEIKGRGKEGAAIANFITPARSDAARSGDLVQQDCLKAWQKAIEDSQHYLYIETQFFQSAYDVDFGYKAEDANKNPIHSGPMQNHITYSFDLVQINAKEAIETLSLSKLNRDALRDIVRYTPQRVPQLLTDFNTLWQQKLSQRITQEVFQGQDVKPTDAKEINTLLDSITKRIQKAIDNEQNYHVYLVMPVHPEGMLNSPATMHTIHLAMQTLFNGKQSFIKRIQKAICVHKIMKDKGYNKDQRPQAEQEAEEMVDNAPRYAKENWRQYLTLLNLRTWEAFTNRGVTEQIYVHSKMLIADDNIAIVGTANVNDRSMLGGRDSEIAAIVRGTQGTKVKLDGKKDYTVSKLVHEFRVNIWRKLFALDIKHPTINPASTLVAHLNSPAAPETWQAIQNRAKRNAAEYNDCFDYIPQNLSPYQAKEAAQEVKGPNPYPLVEQNYYPFGCSIWPQWVYSNPDDHAEGGKLYTGCVMPFDAKFWLGGTNYQFPNYAMPEGIQGFIVELPEQWTMGENNTSLYHHYIVS